jgi:hypothetical protein
MDKGINNNAETQRLFRSKHPHYNSYMCYCQRMRKKGKQPDYTYIEWCAEKIK